MGSYHIDPQGEDGFNPGPAPAAGGFSSAYIAEVDGFSAYHDADYNPPNWKIELTELLRIIQFYNVGSYHIDPQGEDGFNPGPAPE